MGQYRNSIFRIRETHIDGTTTEVDVPVCYTNLEFNPKAVTEENNTNCIRGTRKVPTHIDAEWSLEYKPSSNDLASIGTKLNPGSRISFEIIKNPVSDDGNATDTADYIIEVLRYTTVVERPDTHPGKGLGVRRITGSGGDYYAEQVGRAGFPAPFDSAT